MLIDVNKWIDKNGSFDEAGGLDLVRLIRPKNVLKRARAFLRQDYQYMMFLSHYMGSFQ